MSSLCRVSYCARKGLGRYGFSHTCKLSGSLKTISEGSSLSLTKAETETNLILNIVF